LGRFGLNTNISAGRTAVETAQQAWIIAETNVGKHVNNKYLNKTALALAAMLLAIPSEAPAQSQDRRIAMQVTQTKEAAVSEQEAYTIAQEAYSFFYPLITMDITRRQSTNIEPGKLPGFGPMNSFFHLRAYPAADFKTVVRPNFDTLYSIAWLDLTDEPVVVSVPDTNGRYYLLPMIDMWSDVFAVPGWRTTGTKAKNFLVAPQNWSGTLPPNCERITASTPYVWIVGRTKTDGPDDYAAVHKIQDGFIATPLSRWGKDKATVTVKIDPTVDMKTPPLEQVNKMDAAEYFAYAAKLMKLHPPHVTDWSIISRLHRIGLEPGRDFDATKLDPAIKQALDRGTSDQLKNMVALVPTIGRPVNGWQMNTDSMGVYGNYYLKRAIIAMVGLGANQPEDAIYPLNTGDSHGKPLDGKNNYVLHFNERDLPPVNAFWSLTLYDNAGFQCANSINRFAVSSWMPFKKNSDGSLDLYIQNANPGADKQSNWLPAPTGSFNVTMRLYAPKTEALTGKWNPPAVTLAK
jgi:hypothetical protein